MDVVHVYQVEEDGPRLQGDRRQHDPKSNSLSNTHLPDRKVVVPVVHEGRYAGIWTDAYKLCLAVIALLKVDKDGAVAQAELTHHGGHLEPVGCAPVGVEGKVISVIVVAGLRPETAGRGGGRLLLLMMVVMLEVGALAVLGHFHEADTIELFPRACGWARSRC